MAIGLQSKNYKLGKMYPPSLIAYVLLLGNNLVSNLTYSLDSSTGIITPSSPHPFETGSRIRLNTGLVYPNTVDGYPPLDSITDYFVIKIDGDTFRLARTLQNALANFPIVFSDSGSGVQTLTEQMLNENDPVPVLVKKELNHPNYYRVPIAFNTPTQGYIDYSWTFNVSSGSPNLIFRHKFVMLEGNDTIGDVTGVPDHLFTEQNDKIYLPNQNPLLAIRFSITNP